MRLSRFAAAPFAITTLTGAFLLFQIQPMIGKVILPWFGGTAAVWAVCLVFFQSALLLGYLYAHVLAGRFSPKAQFLVHSGLLALSLLFLPVYPSPAWKPEGAGRPAAQILLLLAATLGLPYLLLSSTGPLVQSWFARYFPKASPYRLYALSNIGSLGALLTYPVVVEPRLSTHSQAVWWSVAYTVFAVSMVAVAYLVKERPTLADAAPGVSGPPLPPSRGQRLLWVALAATPSALLLGVTNHLAHNVAAIPFLWVVPLSLYLLSFVVCFDAERWYVRQVFLPATAVALPVMAYWLTSEFENASVTAKIPLFSAGLFLACMFCHGELVRRKPRPQHLTAFYLTISFGGALGGILVALVAPVVFDGTYELHAALAACALLLAVLLWPTTGRLRAFRAGARSLLALAAAVYALYLGVIAKETSDGYRTTVRNFYGLVRTYDTGHGYDSRRQLVHGTIIHGMQYLTPERRLEPVSYFGPNTGIGRTIRAMRSRRPLRIGVIGLGVATVAAWGRPGDVIRFYELDPTVVEAANRDFTFLRDTQARVEIALGDGRLSLERDSARNFDILMVDAFSSDAVPVHLMTVEAFRLYFRRLAPDGIVVVQASNRFLAIETMAGRIARALGKHTRLVETEDDDETGEFGSTQVLVASGSAAFSATVFADTSAIPDAPHLRPWTDDYSNLFDILK